MYMRSTARAFGHAGVVPSGGFGTGLGFIYGLRVACDVGLHYAGLLCVPQWWLLERSALCSSALRAVAWVLRLGRAEVMAMHGMGRTHRHRRRCSRRLRPLHRRHRQWLTRRSYHYQARHRLGTDVHDDTGPSFSTRASLDFGPTPLRWRRLQPPPLTACRNRRRVQKAPRWRAPTRLKRVARTPTRDDLNATQQPHVDRESVPTRLPRRRHELLSQRAYVSTLACQPAPALSLASTARAASTNDADPCNAQSTDAPQVRHTVHPSVAQADAIGGPMASADVLPWSARTPAPTPRSRNTRPLTRRDALLSTLEHRGIPKEGIRRDEKGQGSCGTGRCSAVSGRSLERLLTIPGHCHVVLRLASKTHSPCVHSRRHPTCHMLPGLWVARWRVDITVLDSPMGGISQPWL
jgi:hypothetical protein